MTLEEAQISDTHSLKENESKYQFLPEVYLHQSKKLLLCREVDKNIIPM
jgi:hypothetical protein